MLLQLVYCIFLDARKGRRGQIFVYVYRKMTVRHMAYVKSVGLQRSL